jgi:hypothetical protein
MVSGAKARPRGGAGAESAGRDAKARRGRWRVVATDRVEYDIDGRRQVAFLAQLGLDGMQLRSASGLAAGARLDFRLFLDGLEKPLVLAGTVDPPSKDGTRVAFASGERFPAALVRYVTDKILPLLEKAAGGQRPVAQKLLELAALYDDLGRDGDALTVYRRALELHKRELVVFERAVDFMLLAVRDGDEVAVAEELEAVIARGLEIGKSALLTAAHNELHAMREHNEQQRAASRREEEAQRRQEEEERRKQEEDRRNEVIAEQAEREAKKRFGALERQLTAEIEEREKAAKQQLAEQRRELAAAKEALEAEHKELKKERRAFEAEKVELDKQSKAQSRELQRAADDAEKLAAMQAELSELRQSVEQDKKAVRAERRALTAEAEATAAARHDLDSERQRSALSHDEKQGALGAELERLRVHDAELVREIAEQKERIEQLEHEVVTTRQRHGHESATLQSEVERARQELHDSEQRLTIAASELAAERKRSFELEGVAGERDKLVSSVKALETRIITLTADLVAANNERATVKTALASEIEISGSLRGELEVTRQLGEERAGEIAALSADLGKLRSEAEGLHARIAELTRQATEAVADLSLGLGGSVTLGSLSGGESSGSIFDMPTPAKDDEPGA